MKAANIKNGVTIFGAKGTFQGIVDTGPINLFTGRNGYLQYGERDRVESTVVGGVFLTWKSYAGSPWYWSGWSTMTVTIPKAINGITEVKIDGWLKTRTNGAIDITYYDDSNWMSWYSSSDMWWEADDYGYSSFWKYGETISISSSKQVHWINFQMNYDRQDWVWCARCIIKYNP